MPSINAIQKEQIPHGFQMAKTVSDPGDLITVNKDGSGHTSVVDTDLVRFLLYDVSIVLHLKTR